MSAAPPKPKIYHITHVKNLPSIVADGVLLSDAAILERQGSPLAIGMPRIKKRRLEEIEVQCHPGTKVGDCVPFYFCPRSIMLYVLHRGNSPDVDYREGQEPILHLEADLHEVVEWADRHGQRRAFSSSNAGALYTRFRSRLDELDCIDWGAVRATDFRSPEVKEGKQAEFLVHEAFPLRLVRRIGVCSRATYARVMAALDNVDGPPKVEIIPSWYY